MGFGVNIWTLLALTPIGVAFLVVGGVALWVYGLMTDRRESEREGKLFSTEPDAITVRSADNVRLLSEDQIQSLEKDE